MHQLNAKKVLKKKCPKHANIPITANKDHWDILGEIHTKGTTKVAITAPTTPVKSKVNSGLSEV